MFRFTFVFIGCLSLALPSHAFFAEAIEAVEAILKEQDPNIKELDNRLASISKRTKARVEKILQSALITPKIRQTLLDALSLFETEFAHKIEEYKKMLAKEAPKEASAPESATSSSGL
jgi:hypothetical protein